jgi:hypothetical protein
MVVWECELANSGEISDRLREFLERRRGKVEGS